MLIKKYLLEKKVDRLIACLKGLFLPHQTRYFHTKSLATLLMVRIWRKKTLSDKRFFSKMDIE
jgi:hypothetical protein